jgi:outer membrane receptor protein involved in Fe transport
VTARGATPNYNRILEDGGGFQGDILAHYWTNDHKIEHRTLITFDANDYYRWDPTISYAPATNADIVAWNAVRTVKLDAEFNPLTPLQYFTKSFNESPGGVVTRNRRIRVTVFGGLLRQQTALLEGRLLSYAGARFDTVHYNDRDYLTAASSFTPFIPGYVVGQKIQRQLSALKPNLGLNDKVSPNLRAFANYSQSYFVTQADAPATIADPTFKPETADGWDYGFKGSALDDRFSYTVSGFYINRHNVSVTDRVEQPIGSGTFVDVTRRDGDQLVRGYEFDANWAVSKEASLLVSYGRVNSVYTDFGTSFPAAIGRKVQYVSPYNGSVSGKYTPRSGSLKGFSANLGVTFVGATPTEAPNAGDVYAPTGARVVTSSTGQWALKAPAYSLWSLGLRYQLQSKSKVSQTFAVNVNNLGNKQYLRVGASSATRLPGEDRAVYFTYTLSHSGSRF